jgi:hypothetical protein
VSTNPRPTVQIKSPDQLTERDLEILRLKKVEGWTFREIGDSLGITRQAAQLAYRRAGGETDRQWPVEKAADAVHQPEVRVRKVVNTAALARLAQISAEGLGRYTLRELCRRFALLPLGQREFPPLDAPFTSSPPGSRTGETITLRWETRWAEFEAAQKLIHQRGYSLSEVIEKRLRQFALTGEIPPEPTLKTLETSSDD